MGSHLAETGFLKGFWWVVFAGWTVTYCILLDLYGALVFLGGFCLGDTDF